MLAPPDILTQCLSTLKRGTQHSNILPSSHSFMCTNQGSKRRYNIEMFHLRYRMLPVNSPPRPNRSPRQRVTHQRLDPSPFGRRSSPRIGSPWFFRQTGKPNTRSIGSVSPTARLTRKWALRPWNRLIATIHTGESLWTTESYNDSCDPSEKKRHFRIPSW
jgi:hypothetical protein